MKAKIGNLEFEVKDRADLELLMRFAGKAKPQGEQTPSLASEERMDFVKKGTERRGAGYAWTKGEDGILKRCSPKTAFEHLKGRSMCSIYLRRRHLGVAEVRRR